MSKRKIIFLICSVLLIFNLTDVLGQTPEEKEEEKRRRYPTIEGEEIVEEVIPPERTWKENWSIDLDASIFHGYDDNASLDAERKEDYFTQGGVDLKVDYKMSDVTDVKFGWNNTNIVYWDYTDATLFDNTLSLGLENEPYEDIIVYAGYEYDYLYFPESELSTYIGNAGEVSLKHKMEENIYHKVSYRYLHKDYKERRARDAVGNLSRHREDNRHGIRYEVGTYAKDAMTKIKTSFHRNDSNDKFLDYYDYDAYRATIIFICMLTEKCYLYANGGYEFKDYKNRSVIDKNEDEEDDIWMWGGSLFYDVTKSLTLGLNYSYREVTSNYSAQEYSGSIASAGVYYSF